jgi:hypothetical protein
MRRKTTNTRGTTMKASMNTKRDTSKWERHALGMSGTQLKSQENDDVKVATVAIQKPYSTPRLFNNMSDDDDHHSTHICLMAKGEKVK